MRETKLYNALVQLSGHELNRLHRFVLSPYFNQNESITRLFEWIKNDLKSDNNIELSKENLWKHVLKISDDYDDRRFRKLQSDLLRLVEEYYAQESFEANPIHKAKYLLDAVFERSLLELQNGTIRTANRLVEDQTLKPASFYYYKYEIEQSTFILNRSLIERSTKSNIENIAENLDRFYLAEKLRYYCTILNHKHLANLNYNMLFIDQIIEHVESNDYSDTPPIVIYYQILLSYKEPEERKHYENIKLLIEKHIHLFPETEVAEILDSALNYCIKRMNSGESEFVREIFELYQNWLKRGLLHVRGKIDPFHFKNIVTAGLRLREFDWIEHFINNFNVFLEQRFQANATTYSLAQLYFYKKDYSNVIRLLSKVEYNDMSYNLDSKTLLMASYYELDEIEALGSFLDTFRVYLGRNKELPTFRRKHYLSTISIVRKLSKIVPGDKKEIEKLQKEIDGTQGVVSKNWILEKLALLNK
ncbi:MAG: hypothetical protein WBP41_04680 [Saprospiraceae bacterium]